MKAHSSPRLRARSTQFEEASVFVSKPCVACVLGLEGWPMEKDAFFQGRQLRRVHVQKLRDHPGPEITGCSIHLTSSSSNCYLSFHQQQATAPQRSSGRKETPRGHQSGHFL